MVHRAYILLIWCEYCISVGLEMQKKDPLQMHERCWEEDNDAFHGHRIAGH